MQVVNPAKGISDYGWHFEQNLYAENSLCRAVKSGQGSGNIPKCIVKKEIKYGNRNGRT